MGRRLLIVLLISFAFTAYASGEDNDANKEAKKIAEKVKQKAERSQKAEGSQDLVKDKVTVKEGDKGQPIVEQVGEASFYSDSFQGKKTATGEKFDQNSRTAAHPTLPPGTKATVTNLDNGNSVNACRPLFPVVHANDHDGVGDQHAIGALCIQHLQAAVDHVDNAGAVRQGFQHAVTIHRLGLRCNASNTARLAALV